MITYAREESLSADEFIGILKRSTRAERRPVKERARIEKTLANAPLAFTAGNKNGLLIGVSRCLADFPFCRYSPDLTADAACQGHEIGERPIEESAAPAVGYVHFILPSAPRAAGFYKKISLIRHPAGFERGAWKRFADEPLYDA